MTHEELDVLEELLVPMKFQKGEMVLSEGETCRNIYWIAKGLVRLFYFKNGKELTVSKAYTYDPLHAMAYTFPRCASSTSVSFPTGLWSHYFTATASSASSTVTVTVTDGNGKVYTETMTRPKAFTVNDYKNK